MKKASQAVKDRQCKFKEAAREFNVPRTTLQDRISGRVVHGVKPGSKLYLNKAEKTELAEFLEVTSSVGYGKAQNQVMEIVKSTAQEKELLRKAEISGSVALLNVSHSYP